MQMVGSSTNSVRNESDLDGASIDETVLSAARSFMAIDEDDSLACAAVDGDITLACAAVHGRRWGREGWRRRRRRLGVRSRAVVATYLWRRMGGLGGGRAAAQGLENGDRGGVRFGDRKMT
jgi:hypothetical protein